MVVVIIGLLAAFVVPNFIGTGEGVKIDLTQAAINGTLTDALNMYRTHMGVYPTTDDGLLALVQPPEDDELALKWRGPYIDEDGLKDLWGNDYIYEYPGEYNENGFDLSSPGPTDDDEDDITNWKKA
jgi:general secretion pathway protein G